MKLVFNSNVGLDNFTESLDLRYPSNQFEVDKDERSVTFNGDKPNSTIMGLAKAHGGEVDED